MNFVFVKDCLLPAENAYVSIEERGFRFGDGVFETIPVHEGVPYRWEYYMERLNKGLAAIRIPNRFNNLPQLCRQVLSTNRQQEGFLRIYISRGRGSRGYLPEPGGEGLLVIESLPKRPEVTEPVDLWLSNYEKISSRALPVECKLAQGLNPALARMEALDRGCFEALQLGSLGQICSASAANIFWLRDNVLYTPALSSGCLAGNIRDVIVNVSPYPVQQGAFMIESLVEASAVFLTNSSYLVVPVRRLVPQGVVWESQALALQMKTLIKFDMANYTKAHAIQWPQSDF